MPIQIVNVDREFSYFPKFLLAKFQQLERALRALASSSGGAACPGGTRGQPRGQGVIPRRCKQKKFFVTNEVSTYGWTHKFEGGNSGLD